MLAPKSERKKQGAQKQCQQNQTAKGDFIGKLDFGKADLAASEDAADSAIGREIRIKIVAMAVGLLPL